MDDTYAFTSRWWVPGDVGPAYDVLVDVERYPEWWPQVRAVGKLGEDRALVACRSLLPKTLHLELQPVVRDREAGVLEATLGGELDGWSRFTLTATDGAVEVRYEQRVTTTGPLMRWLGRTARPLLVLNHDLMMRGARRGLADRLSRSSPHR